MGPVPPSATSRAKVRNASTPWVRWCSASWGTLVRQDPKAIRTAPSPVVVDSVLCGNGVPGSGQQTSSSTSTWYAVRHPGVRSVTSTRA